MTTNPRPEAIAQAFMEFVDHPTWVRWKDAQSWIKERATEIESAQDSRGEDDLTVFVDGLGWVVRCRDVNKFVRRLSTLPDFKLHEALVAALEGES